MFKHLDENTKKYYENNDYTEAIRHAILQTLQIIRDKSNVQVDTTRLINVAFSENNPLIKINRYETDTEKSQQKGIANLLRGILGYFRNSISHSEQKYSKEVADIVLELLDKIILDEIIKSRGVKKIEDFYEEIMNNATPKTERFATAWIETVPSKIRLELLKEVYKNTDVLEKKEIINCLIKGLGENDFEEFCDFLDMNINSTDLKGIEKTVQYINDRIWEKLTIVSKTRIEDLVYEDLKDFNFEIDEYGEIAEQHNGYLLEKCSRILKMFSNFDDILSQICIKICINSNDYIQDYLFDKYLSLITRNHTDMEILVIDCIKKRMKYSNKPKWYQTVRLTLSKEPSDSIWYTELKDVLDLPEPRTFDMSDLPF